MKSKMINFLKGLDYIAMKLMYVYAVLGCIFVIPHILDKMWLVWLSMLLAFYYSFRGIINDFKGNSKDFREVFKSSTNNKIKHSSKYGVLGETICIICGNNVDNKDFSSSKDIIGSRGFGISKTYFCSKKCLELYESSVDYANKRITNDKYGIVGEYGIMYEDTDMIIIKGKNNG